MLEKDFFDQTSEEIVASKGRELVGTTGVERRVKKFWKDLGIFEQRHGLDITKGYYSDSFDHSGTNFFRVDTDEEIVRVTTDGRFQIRVYEEEEVKGALNRIRYGDMRVLKDGWEDISVEEFRILYLKQVEREVERASPAHTRIDELREMLGDLLDSE